MNIVLDRAEKSLCPICVKPITAEFKVEEYNKKKVWICKHHPVRTLIKKSKERRKRVEITWWAYEHKNGGYHFKRYFSAEDLTEANESPFVKRTFGPWDVQSREEAEEKLKMILKKGEGK